MSNLRLKISSYIGLLIFMLAQPLGWAHASDFESVYQSALKNSAELAVIRATSEESSARSKTASSNFFPKVGAESRYETFDSDFEKLKGATTNAYVEWNLFNGFKDAQNQKSLTAEAKSDQLKKSIYEKNFKWLAMAKYAKAFAIQENVEAYKNVIESNRKNLETVKIRRSSGRLSDADLYEFELFDLKLKHELIELETKASAAISELEAFSGQSPLKNLSTVLEPKPLSLNGIDVAEILSTDSSKLYQSRLKVQAAEHKNRVAIGSFLPEVHVKATYGSLGLRETIVSPESAVGITAKWELFSGLESVNERRAAQAQLTQAKAIYAYEKIQLLNRARQLIRQIDYNYHHFELEEKNKKNVDKFLRTVHDEYRRGVKNSSDLKAALELVLDTYLDRSNLRAEYFSSRAELQEILGIEIKEQ